MTMNHDQAANFAGISPESLSPAPGKSARRTGLGLSAFAALFLAFDVEFAKSMGLFLDRNNSLLASVRVTNVQDYFVQFDVYPNAFTTPQLGMFGVVDKMGHFVFGVSFAHSLGFGAGLGTLLQ